MNPTAGDLVLFSRPCFRMGTIACGLCLSAKIFSGTEYDHVGIVIESPTTKELFLLEANMQGVTLLPLSERLTRSKAYAIAIRKLTSTDPTFKARLWRLSKEYLQLRYNTSMTSNIKAMIDSHTDHAFLWNNVRHAASEHILKALQAELEHATSPHMQQVISQRITHLQHELHQNQSTAVPTTDGLIASGCTNCSQLVGDILSRLGVLRGPRAASSYIPADFSSNCLLPTLLAAPGYSFAPDYILRPAPDPKAPSQCIFAPHDVVSIATSAMVTVAISAGHIHVLSDKGRVVAELGRGEHRIAAAAGWSLHGIERSVVSLSSSPLNSPPVIAGPCSTFLERHCGPLTCHRGNPTRIVAASAVTQRKRNCDEVQSPSASVTSAFLLRIVHKLL